MDFLRRHAREDWLPALRYPQHVGVVEIAMAEYRPSAARPVREKRGEPRKAKRRKLLFRRRMMEPALLLGRGDGTHAVDHRQSFARR